MPGFKDFPLGYPPKGEAAGLVNRKPRSVKLGHFLALACFPPPGPAADTRSTRQQGLAIGLACIPRSAHALQYSQPFERLACFCSISPLPI